MHVFWFDTTYDSLQPLFKKIGLQCFSDAISRHSCGHMFSTVMQVCICIEYIFGVNCMFTFIAHSNVKLKHFL